MHFHFLFSLSLTLSFVVWSVQKPIIISLSYLQVELHPAKPCERDEGEARCGKGVVKVHGNGEMEIKNGFAIVLGGARV